VPGRGFGEVGVEQIAQRWPDEEVVVRVDDRQVGIKDRLVPALVALNETLPWRGHGRFPTVQQRSHLALVRHRIELLARHGDRRNTRALGLQGEVGVAVPPAPAAIHRLGKFLADEVAQPHRDREVAR
jgi:hypothetical protein